MGIDKNEDNLKRRKLRKHVHGPADWGSCDAQRLVRALAQLTSQGMAIQFGYTRDGGAYALRIYGDKTEPYSEYFPPDEEPIEFLESLCEYKNEQMERLAKKP